MIPQTTCNNNNNENNNACLTIIFPGLPSELVRENLNQSNLDVTEARDSGWQWHQLDHMQICTSLQTDNHTSTNHSVFTGQMALLPLINSINALKVQPQTSYCSV